VNILYILCREQAETYGVSDVQFGRGMAGGILELATTALLKELVSFFPSQKRRVLTKALEKMKEGEGLAMTKAIEKIDKLNLQEEFEKLEKKLEAQQNASGEQSGGSPGTSA